MFIFFQICLFGGQPFPSRIIKNNIEATVFIQDFIQLLKKIQNLNRFHEWYKWRNRNRLQI